jgi:hypothetical protein
MSSLGMSGCIGIAFENGDIVNPIVSRYNVASEVHHRSQEPTPLIVTGIAVAAGLLTVRFFKQEPTLISRRRKI